MRGDRYGLGSVFHRQQKQAWAEYHFRKAIEINPCVGTRGAGS